MKKTLISLSILIISACSETTNPEFKYTQPKLSHQVEYQPSVDNTPTQPSNTITMDESVLSFGTDFTMSNGGKVEERVLSMTSTFEYTDRDGTLVSRAEEEFLSWGVKIDVYDNKHQVIGFIEEEIFESMFSFENTYSIKDGSGKIIAKSKKLDFFSTDIKLYDLSGQLVALMSRPAINFISDTWTIEIIQKDVIDERILFLIPPFKTSEDNRKSSEK